MAKGGNNYIARLIKERDEAVTALGDIHWKLVELEVYLTSTKFYGTDNDYVHVSTDILPKISNIRFAAIKERM
jgi:hypothetical protein